MSTKLLACLLLPKTLLLLLLPLAPAALADDGIPNWPGLTWAMSVERLRDSVGNVEQVPPDQQTVHTNRCRGRHALSNVLHLDVRFTRASFCDHEGKLLGIDLVQRGSSKDELQGGYDVIHHALLGQFGEPQPDRKSNRATWKSGGTRIDVELHDDPVSRRSFLALSYSPDDFQDPATSVSPTPSKDVAGWRNIPWGADHATIAETLGRYPGEDASREGAFIGRPGVCMVHLIEQNHSFLGERFEVRFCEADHQLRGVWLGLPGPSAQEQQNVFERLKRKLEAEYGPSGYGDPEHPEDDYRTWSFPSTVINLAFNPASGEVMLSFEPADVWGALRNREPPKDVAGWNGIPWLATPEAIRRATTFPVQSTSGFLRTGELACTGDIHAEKVPFLAQTFKVYFCLQKKPTGFDPSVPDYRLTRC